MKVTRRRLRNRIGKIIGIQADMHIWWTPELPLIYVSNAKAGCSTIKQSLKTAQANAYTLAGRSYARVDDPHADDDCLRRKGLEPGQCRDRHLFSCVRNPFARALSGYLDKVVRGDTRRYPELWGMKDRRGGEAITFEAFLRAVAADEPTQINDHFRPQTINLNSANIDYDAVFFLENLCAMPIYFAQIVPELRMERYAPHARGAVDQLQAHYTATTLDLVRDIYASDFDAFGYSRDLPDTLKSPGAMLAEGKLLPAGSERSAPLIPQRASNDRTTLEKTLRCRWLIERGLI